MSDLFRFLTDLATNPHQQTAFGVDPLAVMTAAGLSEAEQAVLQSRERATVAAAFANELEQPAFLGFDPGPDPLPDPDPPPAPPES